MIQTHCADISSHHLLPVKGRYHNGADPLAPNLLLPCFFYTSAQSFQQWSSTSSIFRSEKTPRSFYPQKIFRKCACCTKRRNKSCRSDKCVIWCNQKQCSNKTKSKTLWNKQSMTMLMPIYELITTTTDSSEKTSSTAACLTEQILHHMTHVDAETCNKCGCCTKWRNKFFKWGWSWNDNT